MTATTIITSFIMAQVIFIVISFGALYILASWIDNKFEKSPDDTKSLEGLKGGDTNGK